MMGWPCFLVLLLFLWIKINKKGRLFIDHHLNYMSEIWPGLISFLGQYIVREGTSGDTFYIISDGGVRVTKKTGGREEEIRSLARGDYFGEQVSRIILLWGRHTPPHKTCDTNQKTVWRTKLNMTAKCFLLQSHEILWVASSHGT